MGLTPPKPETRPARRRLESLAEQADAFARVTVVRAPAGYGKSRLLKMWRHALESRDRVVEAFDVPQGGDVQWLRSRLARRPVGSDAIVMVDGAERLGPADQAWLAAHLDADSWSPKLVLATRAHLQIGLPRALLAGRAQEIDAGDLRLTENEVVARLSETGALDPALRAAAVRLTDGWPAAVGFAAHAIEAGATTRSELLAALTQPSGLFARYFEEEVLVTLGEPDRALLVAMATLHRFCADLLRDVAGLAEAEAAIRRFEHLGLFVRPGSEGWRSLNPLVAAHLDGGLRRADPARAVNLHRRAAEWHRDHGRLADAIPHAFAAGDVAAAAKLLVAASRTHERIGRWRAFVSWTSRLAPEQLDREPALRLEAAASHAVLLEFEAARAHLDRIRALAAGLSDAQRAALTSAEAILAAFSDDAERAGACGEAAEADHPRADAYTRGVFLSARALGCLGRDDIAQARRLSQEALAVHENGGNRFGATFALALSGLTAAVGGDLSTAMSEWRRGAKTIRPLETAAAVEAVASGYLPLALFEWNSLPEAATLVEQCFSSSVEVALPDAVASLYLTAARMAEVAGDPQKALSWLAEGELVGLRRGWLRLSDAIAWERIMLGLRHEGPQEGARLRARLERDRRTAGRAAPWRGLEVEGDVPALRYALLIRPDRAAFRDARAAIARASAQGRNWRATRLLVVEAAAREAIGDRAAGLRAMRRALEMARKGRLIRTFVDEGAQAARLLSVIADEEARVPGGTIDLAQLAEILSVLGDAREPAARPRNEVEALSRREAEVLTMVAAGLSNRELAQRLFVSENTVKWHLQHVFAKLGVANRTRALVVAREHGLLPS